MSLRVFTPRVSLALVLALGLASCARELDRDAFKREAERAYIDTHPGWSIVRRDAQVTTFVRGDQVDQLDVGVLFEAYKKSGQGASDWFDTWKRDAEAEARARRKTLAQSKDTVVPVLKSGSWIRVQDLGAIGPKHLQDKIRPWRKELATDLVVLLGVPEEGLGHRFASMEEVKESPDKEELWLERAIENLRRRVGTSTGTETRGSDDRLLTYDLAGTESISALVLDKRFRAEMLERFGKEELGAAAPIRDALYIFDPAEFVAVRPVRARAHQLYDTQNHPAFRGLLRFDRNGLSVLEAASPEVKKKAAE